MSDAWKIALGAAIGFLISVFAEPFRRWWYQSKLRIEFETVYESGSKYLHIATHDTSFIRWYVRGVVYNDSASVAKGCRVYLTAIDKRTSEKEPFKRIHHQPFPLIWSYMNTDSIDIPKSLPFLFDILAWNGNEDESPAPQTRPEARNWKYSFLEEGWYRFTMMATGENCRRATFTIQLHWKKPFDEFPKGSFAIIPQP